MITVGYDTLKRLIENNVLIELYFIRLSIILAEKKKDYKAIVMIEKEKQLTVERLIKVGRLASPFERV